jgi:hypothetical protein
MAYSDPQSITFNAVATSFPRTGSSANAGKFTTADGQYTLSVSHAYGKRTRRVIRVDQTQVSADPLIPAQNLRASASVYLVVDAPTFGFTTTQLKYVVDGLTAYLAASSGAKVTQLLGGEI